MEYKLKEMVQVTGSPYVPDGVYKVNGSDDSDMPVEVKYNGDLWWINEEHVSPVFDNTQYIRILEAIAGKDAVDMARNINEALNDDLTT